MIILVVRVAPPAILYMIISAGGNLHWCVEAELLRRGVFRKRRKMLTDDVEISALINDLRGEMRECMVSRITNGRTGLQRRRRRPLWGGNLAGSETTTEQCGMTDGFSQDLLYTVEPEKGDSRWATVVSADVENPIVDEE